MPSRKSNSNKGRSKQQQQQHEQRKKKSHEDRLVEQSFQLKHSTPIMELICDPGTTPSYFQLVLDRHTDYAFLNQQDPELNMTPLCILACRFHQPNATALTQILLQPKYNVDIHLRAGLTGSQPIYCGAECGTTEIVKMLIDKGADIMSQQPCGKPTRPINIAIQNGHNDIVAHLLNAAVAQRRVEDILSTTNLYHQSPMILSMIRQRTEMIGMIAKVSGPNTFMKRGFHVYWAINPNDEENCDYMDPDPNDSKRKAHYGLYKTVYSFTTQTCCCCRAIPQQQQQQQQPSNATSMMMRCSRCRMAWYCNAGCQKKDFKIHKLCCKKLKAGMDKIVIGSGNGNGKLNESITSSDDSDRRFCGFVEPFDEVKNEEVPDSYDRNTHAVWEYLDEKSKDDDGSSSSNKTLEWKRYPPLVEEGIEDLKNMGSPRYMYRPNKPECAGNYHNAPFPKDSGPDVSTRYVYFDVMMEFDVYTGAARAVRRNGMDNPGKEAIDDVVPDDGVPGLHSMGANGHVAAREREASIEAEADRIWSQIMEQNPLNLGPHGVMLRKKSEV